ncbi:MAG: type 4a pilus biogenesis protein PilO [Bacillota bacterium]
MQKKIDTADILIFLLIALVLASMLILIYNQLLTARGAYLGVAEEQAALARDQDRLEQLASLKNRAGELQESVARFDHLMPREPEEQSLLNDIDALAGQCGAQLTGFRLEERVNGQEYIEMPFKATFQGRYQNLVSLLGELKKSPRAIRIDEVKLGKGDRDLPYIQAEISASAFYAPGAGMTGQIAPGS